MADIQQLADKLLQHKTKLAGVENALSSNPSDEVLLKLKEDLKQVIDLTTKLYKMKLAKAPQHPASVPGGTVTEFNFVDWKVGDLCYARWTDGERYIAKIINKVHDEAEIQYLEYGDTTTTNLSGLKPYASPEASEYNIGCLCKALHSDGFLYNGSITRAGTKDNYVVVTYDHDQSVVEIAKSQILEVTPVVVVVEEQKNADIIPDYLKPSPLDSEAQRQTKRRKIKSIKAKLKEKEHEELRLKSQSSWQSFKAKRNGKSVSMFKSPDSVTGKVGVTGSGAPMTEFASRDQYKLSKPKD